ncbi:MAG TPA: hypothetical protein DEB06_02170, partial [Phycisphaerales bacterium]|nr:hypothetical protein [Phycisphaerales bacterium]
MSEQALTEPRTTTGALSSAAPAETRRVSLAREAPADTREKTERERALDGAIAEGKAFDTVVHQAVLGEDPILEVRDFQLFYGSSKALHSVNMVFPRNKVTALIGPSGCG